MKRAFVTFSVTLFCSCHFCSLRSNAGAVTVSWTYPTVAGEGYTIKNLILCVIERSATAPYAEKSGLSWDCGTLKTSSDTSHTYACTSISCDFGTNNDYLFKAAIIDQDDVEGPYSEVAYRIPQPPDLGDSGAITLTSIGADRLTQPLTSSKMGLKKSVSKSRSKGLL